MQLWQLPVLAYAAVYFVLAGLMEVANLNQSYPLPYIAVSMIAQMLMVCGVLIFALERTAAYAKLWRWLFPILVLELAVGIVLDVFYQTDAASLWMDELFGLWLAAPAYYFNLRVAGYRA
jgi:hypothetical protein